MSPGALALGNPITGVAGRAGAGEPDHRHRRLLRVRRERPRSRRATEKRDEVAPSDLIGLHSVPCQQARAELQDIELARISQEVTERFCNLSALGGERRSLVLLLCSREDRNQEDEN